eukprot:1756475-Pleurochrysis_carterae.AAC.1
MEWFIGNGPWALHTTTLVYVAQPRSKGVMAIATKKVNGVGARGCWKCDGPQTCVAICNTRLCCARVVCSFSVLYCIDADNLV